MQGRLRWLMQVTPPKRTPQTPEILPSRRKLVEQLLCVQIGLNVLPAQLLSEFAPIRRVKKSSSDFRVHYCK